VVASEAGAPRDITSLTANQRNGYVKERQDDSVYLYRYDLTQAHFLGVHEHPEIVIRRHFPEATNIEPAAVVDCWFFKSRVEFGVPEYFVRMRRVSDGASQ